MRIAPVAGRGRARNECDVGVSSRDLCIRSTTMSSFFFEKRSETENDEKGHYPLLVDHSLTTKRPTSPCSTCSETCSAVPVTKAASKLQPPRLVRDPEWWKLRGRGTRPSLGHQIAQVAEFRFFHCPTFANREPHNANALTPPPTPPTPSPQKRRQVPVVRLQLRHRVQVRRRVQVRGEASLDSEKSATEIRTRVQI
jgi:hypothetical protein